MPQLSVILCTHNPRRTSFDRTMASLQRQSLACDAWELIVVDNASAPAVSSYLDASWHPAATILSEPTLGLTAARRCGINAAGADLLVLVDDDNELDVDYLAEAARIGRDYPFLGAWGGSTIGEFETQPPRWVKPYLFYLAVRAVGKERWSNDIDDWAATPLGAGLCVRTSVARRYLSDLDADPIRAALDRRGASLEGGGDIDLAYTSRRFGLGWGVFPSLRLTHLIPSGRIESGYMVRLIEAAASSMVVLSHRIGRKAQGAPPLRARVASLLRLFLRGEWRQAPFLRARFRGLADGRRRLDALSASAAEVPESADRASH